MGYISNVGGGVGGGGAFGPSPAPNKWVQIAQCASKTANQFSIAGVLGINEETHPVGAALSNAFLENTFSGISDTITHVATGHLGAAYADFALGGTAQGLRIGTVPAAKGAAGVTGSGFVVLASTLTAIKVIPVEGLALLLGVDRFMSEARAITNFIGNGVATIWISNNEKEFDRNKMNLAFGQNTEIEVKSKKSKVKI